MLLRFPHHMCLIQFIGVHFYFGETNETNSFANTGTQIAIKSSS